MPVVSFHWLYFQALRLPTKRLELLYCCQHPLELAKFNPLFFPTWIKTPPTCSLHPQYVYDAITTADARAGPKWLMCGVLVVHVQYDLPPSHRDLVDGNPWNYMYGTLRKTYDGERDHGMI